MYLKTHKTIHIMSGIRNLVHSTIYGIKNLIAWFPLIWSDRNWDSSYILKILQFKIKRTANSVERNSHYVGCKIDVQKMRTCIRLIDKINNYDYELEYQDYCTPGLYTKFLNVPYKNNCKEYFEKYPNDYRRVLDKENLKDSSIALYMSTNRHQRAMNLLFDFMKHNLQRWGY